TRRRFFRHLTGLALPPISFSRCAAAQNAGIARRDLMPPASRKAVVQKGDFEYRGAFRLPVSGATGDPSWGMGLTHRWVNRRLHFFSRSHGNPPPPAVYEVAAPALSDFPATASVASVARVWGDVAAEFSYGNTWGLHWDDEDQRLYYTNGNSYNTKSP